MFHTISSHKKSSKNQLFFFTTFTQIISNQINSGYPMFLEKDSITLLNNEVNQNWKNDYYLSVTLFLIIGLFGKCWPVRLSCGVRLPPPLLGVHTSLVSTKIGFGFMEGTELPWYRRNFFYKITNKENFLGVQIQLRIWRPANIRDQSLLLLNIVTNTN